MDPALWELLRVGEGAHGDRLIEAVIRFAEPGTEVPGARVIARFGTIATCRLRARDVIAVRARPEVISIKAARGVNPGFEVPLETLDWDVPSLPPTHPTDIRRDRALDLTGAGVVVASVDWGVDVASAALRWPDEPSSVRGRTPGGTRFLAFWDQRDQALGPAPARMGMGACTVGRRSTGRCRGQGPMSNSVTTRRSLIKRGPALMVTMSWTSPPATARLVAPSASLPRRT